jgi:dTDP-4-amino-4,6-dideoxygalactose transaminase
MVPFLDLAAATAELRAEIDAAVARVVGSGWYIGGTEVTAFEERYADYCGAGHCVGVGNGLDALFLVLAAMGVGAGDEVIVASNGFIATLLAVSRLDPRLQLLMRGTKVEKRNIAHDPASRRNSS